MRWQNQTCHLYRHTPCVILCSWLTNILNFFFLPIPLWDRPFPLMSPFTLLLWHLSTRNNCSEISLSLFLISYMALAYMCWSSTFQRHLRWCYGLKLRTCKRGWGKNPVVGHNYLAAACNALSSSDAMSHSYTGHGNTDQCGIACLSIPKSTSTKRSSGIQWYITLSESNVPHISYTWFTSRYISDIVSGLSVCCFEVLFSTEWESAQSWLKQESAEGGNERQPDWVTRFEW